MRILVVEDDHRVARGLVTALVRAGFEVARVATAADALAAAPADIVLLDLGLPDADGIAVCRQLRRRGSAGIIMVTARGMPKDRVLGLRSGADDYVVKPFGVDELLARIEAVARRTRPERAAPQRLGRIELPGLELDLDGHRAVVSGRPLELTPKEFDLLALLVAHRGQVVSRSRIIDQIWQAAYETPSRTLDVHVAALRAKLPAEGGVRIETVRGVGYRLHTGGPETVSAATDPGPGDPGGELC
ncbi:MAG TPA: response regulator transcription factor [Kineosporiaceae bacterium]|nr:response regulator transcription factor [Kineosporiaceae bacterium]